MNNITEIIYGDSMYHTIKQCDFVRNNKIIKFDKFLSFADLSNMDKNEIKLNKDFCDFIYPEINHKFDVTQSIEDLNRELDDAIKRNSKIRIWSTHQESESYLTFIYVCNYLFDSNCDIYVMFSDEYDNECYSPACMNEPELKELIKLEHKLSKEEIFDYTIEWKKVVEDNSDMRVIENNKVKSVSLDYYDDIILNRLSELGEVKSVLLTANLMKDYHMSDIFISYLINRLIKTNKIKIIEEGKSLWHSVIAIIKENN